MYITMITIIIIIIIIVIQIIQLIIIIMSQLKIITCAPHVQQTARSGAVQHHTRRNKNTHYVYLMITRVIMCTLT